MTPTQRREAKALIRKVEKMKEEQFNSLPQFLQDTILTSKRMYAEWFLDYVKNHGRLPLEVGTTTVRTSD